MQTGLACQTFVKPYVVINACRGFCIPDSSSARGWMHAGKELSKYCLAIVCVAISKGHRVLLIVN